jgi:hypothetical protein
LRRLDARALAFGVQDFGDSVERALNLATAIRAIIDRRSRGEDDRRRSKDRLDTKLMTACLREAIERGEITEKLWRLSF